MPRNNLADEVPLRASPGKCDHAAAGENFGNADQSGLINGRHVREVQEGGIKTSMLEGFPIDAIERIEVVKVRDRSCTDRRRSPVSSTSSPSRPIAPVSRWASPSGPWDTEA